MTHETICTPCRQLTPEEEARADAWAYELRASGLLEEATDDEWAEVARLRFPPTENPLLVFPLWLLSHMAMTPEGLWLRHSDEQTKGAFLGALFFSTEALLAATRGMPKAARRRASLKALGLPMPLPSDRRPVPENYRGHA